MSNTIAITWVNTVVNDKSVKVYLTSPDFQRGVTHWAWVPAHLSPRKWDTISASEVKLGTVEVDWTDEATGQVTALKNPRRQVSFFGSVTLGDPAPMEATEWVDNRSKPADPESF